MHDQNLSIAIDTKVKYIENTWFFFEINIFINEVSQVLHMRAISLLDSCKKKISVTSIDHVTNLRPKSAADLTNTGI